MLSVVRLFTVTTTEGMPLYQLRDGSLSAHRSCTAATSDNRTTRPSTLERITMSSNASASYPRNRPRTINSSRAVFKRPPVVSTLAARIAADTSAKVMFNSVSLSARMATSISSPGNPLNATWLMPSKARKSCSIRRASVFKALKSSTPVTANVMATPMASCLNTVGGSIPTGNEAMRSTAFFTSCKISSVSPASKTVTVMLPAFSEHTDFTWSRPAMPWRFSSILATMPSSISAGDAPG